MNRNILHALYSPIRKHRSATVSDYMSEHPSRRLSRVGIATVAFMTIGESGFVMLDFFSAFKALDQKRMHAAESARLEAAHDLSLLIFDCFHFWHSLNF